MRCRKEETAWQDKRWDRGAITTEEWKIENNCTVDIPINTVTTLPLLPTETCIDLLWQASNHTVTSHSPLQNTHVHTAAAQITTLLEGHMLDALVWGVQFKQEAHKRRLELISRGSVGTPFFLLIDPDPRKVRPLKLWKIHGSYTHTLSPLISSVLVCVSGCRVGCDEEWMTERQEAGGMDERTIGWERRMRKRKREEQWVCMYGGWLSCKGRHNGRVGGEKKQKNPERRKGELALS